MFYLILFEIFKDTPDVQDPHFAVRVTLGLCYAVIAGIGAIYGHVSEIGGWRGAWLAVRNAIVLEITIIIAIIVVCAAFNKAYEAGKK